MPEHPSRYECADCGTKVSLTPEEATYAECDNCGGELEPVTLGWDGEE